jgi:hypothetical protein
MTKVTLPMSSANKTDATSSKGGHSELGEVPPYPEIDETADEEKRILECLGAAVVMRWGTLPTKIQRELFEYAISLTELTDPRQTAHLKGQIARLLHDRKDDSLPTTRTMLRRNIT